MKIRTTRFLYMLALTALMACNRNTQEASRNYYRQQVNERISAIMTDTSYRELPAIHEEIERIILVSKDSENPQAAVALAGTLFDSLSETYGFQRADFPDIEKGMPAAEVEMRIRENELAFFDRLVMKADPASAKLFTAH